MLVETPAGPETSTISRKQPGRLPRALFSFPVAMGALLVVVIAFTARKKIYGDEQYDLRASEVMSNQAHCAVTIHQSATARLHLIESPQDSLVA
jgi:hypothetical protein